MLLGALYNELMSMTTFPPRESSVSCSSSAFGKHPTTMAGTLCVGLHCYYGFHSVMDYAVAGMSGPVSSYKLELDKGRTDRFLS